MYVEPLQWDRRFGTMMLLPAVAGTSRSFLSSSSRSRLLNLGPRLSPSCPYEFDESIVVHNLRGLAGHVVYDCAPYSCFADSGRSRVPGADQIGAPALTESVHLRYGHEADLHAARCSPSQWPVSPAVTRVDIRLIRADASALPPNDQLGPNSVPEGSRMLVEVLPPFVSLRLRLALGFGLLLGWG